MITELWAITQEDKGKEHLVLAVSAKTLQATPLLCITESQIPHILEVGRQVSKAMGLTFKLVKFSVREEIQEVHTLT